MWPTPSTTTNDSSRAMVTVSMRRAGDTYCGPCRDRISGCMMTTSAIASTMMAMTRSMLPMSDAASRVGHVAAPDQVAGTTPQPLG
jgi:hypothetical protein